MSNGKTNKYNKVQYMGGLRHANPLLCVLGALAQYFVSRWHLSGEEFPSFQTRQDWYRIKVLSSGGQDRTKALSYPTQYEATWKAFALAEINSVQKTHVMRGLGQGRRSCMACLKAR
jgi:Centromere DNA-binding protein complex CBF3 subunit, domain 2